MKRRCRGRNSQGKSSSRIVRSPAAVAVAAAVVAVAVRIASKSDDLLIYLILN